MNIKDRSWLEISKKNLQYNIESIKEFLRPEETIMATVKANAYGYGVKIVAKELYKLGIRFFSVATIDEAIELRKMFNDVYILILGFTPYERTEDLIKYELVQTITSKDHLDELYKCSQSKIRVHLAINTGMSRIGLQTNDITETIKEINDSFNKYLVEGVFTHLTCADMLDKNSIEFTEKQISLFEALYEEFKDKIQYFHYKNSAACIRRFPRIGNLIRPGIIMYGQLPSQELKGYIDLKPIIKWYSLVSCIRTIEEGEAVGYGNTYIAQRKTVVATITTGYADGYNRLLSNQGYVLINGQIAPVIGRICMDKFMVDVSNIDNVSTETIVTLIGEKNQNIITVDDLAKLCNTINYEIVCNITNRVKRYAK